MSINEGTDRDYEERMNLGIPQEDNEDRLRRQLDKALDIIGSSIIGTPCPSDYDSELKDTKEHGVCIDCRECWKKALEEME